MIVLAAPWLLLLLPAPFLVRVALRPHEERRDAVHAPFVEELAELAGRSGDAAVTAPRTLVQALAFVFAWACVVLALARPQFIGAPIEKTVPTRDMLLAVDLSASMSTEDFVTPEGERIERLIAVKLVLDTFLARRAGDRVGLVLFGSAPFVQAPFTEDLDACRALLDEARVGMAGPRTVVGDAIGLAITVFESSELEDRVLILLTDGNDTDSRVPPARAAEIAAERGITIHTVAVGDPTAVGEEKLDVEALNAITRVTGGEFARAENLEELESVYARLDEIAARDLETISHRPRRDLFQWPLAAFFVAVFGFHVTHAGPRWLRMRSATE